MCVEDRASVQLYIQGLLTEVALQGVLCMREVRFRALTILMWSAGLVYSGADLLQLKTPTFASWGHS